MDIGLHPSAQVTKDTISLLTISMKTEKTKPFLYRHQIRIALAILILGFALRLFMVFATEGYSLRLEDEVRDLGRAKAWLVGDVSARYLGAEPYDAGFRTPSFINHGLHALLLSLHSSPLAPLFGMTILGTLSIWLTYLSLNVMFPSKPAYTLITTFMVAVFPFPVIFSTGIWNPNYIFPGSSIVLFGLVLWVFKEKPIGLVIASAGLVLLAQFHMIAIFLLCAFMSIWFVFRPKTSGGTLVLAAAPWVVFYGGYLLVDAIQGFANTRAFLHSGNYFMPEALKIFSNPIFTPSTEISRWISWRNFYLPTVGGGFFSKFASALGPGFGEYMRFHNQALGSFVISLVVNLLNVVFIVGSFVFVTGAGWQHMKKGRGDMVSYMRAHKAVYFVALWVLVPALFYLLSTKAHSLRYTQIMWPFLFLFQVVFFFQEEKRDGFWKVYRIFFPFVLVYGLYVTCAFGVITHKRITESQEMVPSLVNLDAVSRMADKDARDASGWAVFVPGNVDARSLHAFGIQRLNQYMDSVTRWGEKNDQEEPLPVIWYIVNEETYMPPDARKIKVGEFRNLVISRCSSEPGL